MPFIRGKEVSSLSDGIVVPKPMKLDQGGSSTPSIHVHNIIRGGGGGGGGGSSCASVATCITNDAAVQAALQNFIETTTFATLTVDDLTVNNTANLNDVIITGTTDFNAGDINFNGNTINHNNTTTTGTQNFDMNYIGNYVDSIINYTGVDFNWDNVDFDVIDSSIDLFNTDIVLDAASTFTNDGDTFLNGNVVFTNADIDLVNTTLDIDSTSVTNFNGGDINYTGNTITNVGVTETYDATSNVTFNNAVTFNVAPSGLTPDVGGLAGVVDGVNAVFILPATPTGDTVIFVNGLKQTNTVDYNIVGVTVTFVPAETPQIGDVLTFFNLS